jgi:hypothetical protein
MATGNAQRPLGVSDPVPAQSGQALSQPVAISKADFLAYGTLKYGANVNRAYVAAGATGGASEVTAAPKPVQLGQTSGSTTTTDKNIYNDGDQKSGGDTGEKKADGAGTGGEKSDPGTGGPGTGGEKSDPGTGGCGCGCGGCGCSGCGPGTGDQKGGSGTGENKQPEPPAPDTQPEPPPDMQPEPPAPDEQPEPPVDTQPEPPVPDTQPEPPAPDTQPEEDDGSSYGLTTGTEKRIKEILHNMKVNLMDGDQAAFEANLKELRDILDQAKKDR